MHLYSSTRKMKVLGKLNAYILYQVNEQKWFCFLFFSLCFSIFSETGSVWEIPCVMNILFNACSAATFTRTSRRAAKSSIGVFSALSWRTCVGFTATAKVDSDLFFKQICVRCYSSKKSRGESSSSQKSDLTPQMKEDRDGFFVVRKGNLVGVYKNLSDCQTQVGSSVTTIISLIYWSYWMFLLFLEDC